MSAYALYALLLIFPIAMAFAASMDLLTMTIPNRVSIALVGAFILAAPLSGMTMQTLASHAAAGALMLAIGIAMFAKKWVGGGDAKLLASVSLWLGFGHLLNYLLLVTLAGGGLALFVMMYRSFTLPAVLAGQPWAARLHEKDGGIPYGIAIAVAGLIVFPSTAWIRALGG